MAGRSGKYDCIVVGGGPSGSILAARLAEWGRRVLLLDGALPPPVLVEETIGADATLLLRRHGLTASIRAHGFHGTPRAGVVWGDGELRVERRPRDRRGFKVMRDLFDRDLRRFAAAPGADVMTANVVEARADSVLIARSGGRTERIAGRTVVVAVGAAAAANLLPVEVAHRLPLTMAVTSLVERPRRFRDAMILEAVEQGWTRWLPREDGRVAATLFADADDARESGVAETFVAARAGSSGPFASAEARTLHVLEVEVRHQVTAEGVFLCGDAAGSADPLLGQGIEKAIRSGEACAIAVNSSLEDRGLLDRVLEHHEATEHDLYLEYARRALGLYLQEVRFSERPFWERRHQAVQVEVEADMPALPSHLAVGEGVALREGLRLRGRVLEPVRGWGLRDSSTVHERVACVPVNPLIKLVRGTRSTDELLDLAGFAPDLYLHSRASIQRALTELVRLGIIVAADGGRTP